MNPELLAGLGTILGVTLLGLLLWRERRKLAAIEIEVRAAKAKAATNERLEDEVRSLEEEIRELDSLLAPSTRFDRMFNKDR